MEEQIETVNQMRETIVDLAIRFGPKLLTALLILIAGVFVSRWAARWMARALHRIELEPPVRLLLARIASGVVFALFLIMALQNLGVELLPLIAGLGVAGAGIALAMQGVLSNVAAGLAIIFSKPFRVGEYISVVDEEGRVESISLFSTTLSHVDRSLVVIPNRKIAGEVLHNFGTLRQVEVTVAIDRDADLERALAAVHAVLRGNEKVLSEPAPIVATSLMPDSRIGITAKPWVKVPDHGSATSEIGRALVEAFRAAEIPLAAPPARVRLVESEATKSG